MPSVAGRVRRSLQTSGSDPRTSNTLSHAMDQTLRLILLRTPENAENDKRLTRISACQPSVRKARPKGLEPSIFRSTVLNADCKSFFFKELTTSYCQMLWIGSFGSVAEPLRGLLLIFSSTGPPKPYSGLVSIWLRLGADDIEAASPKAIPHFSFLSILSR
jgi:hypothetical protein